MSENKSIDSSSVLNDSPERKRIRYTARVEYLAVKATVDQMLAQGHRVKSIFEEMTRTGRITISYTSFCDYVRGGGQRFRKSEGHRKNPKRPTTPPRPPARVGSSPSIAPDGPFVFDKDIDISELV